MPETPGISCVMFDAVGTVIEAEPSVVDVYFQTGQKFGSCLTRSHVAERLSTAFHLSERRDLQEKGGSLETSEEHELQRWRTIVASVLDDVRETELCFQTLFDYFGDPAAWRCYDDVFDAVRYVQQRGLRWLIGSNFDGRLRAVCAGLEPLCRADVVVVSSEVGCRKPGERFFEAVVEAAECPRERILVVGDDLENDVRGARQWGLNAVHLVRTRGSAADHATIRSLADLAGRLM